MNILWSHVSNAPGPVYWHSTPAMAEITDKLQYNNLWSSAQPGQCHTCQRWLTTPILLGSQNITNLDYAEWSVSSQIVKDIKNIII